MARANSSSPDAFPARSGRAPLPEHQPEDFFFLRSPLLPVERLEALLAAEAAAEALEPGARLERAAEALFELAAEPAIAEALFVASPELCAGLERAGDGEAAPNGNAVQATAKPAAKRGERLRQSLTRYLLRLLTRPTPFGLFAGGALGRLGAATELALAGREEYRRHTRLDMDYLDRLARDLESDPFLREALVYRPNSSLYRAAGRLRYAEGRLEGQARAYHLVALRADLFLDAALAAAREGAGLAAIARAVRAADPEAEIDDDEAAAFVHELIDTQVLVSDLGPRVTGELPIHGLVRRLAGIAGQEAAAARLGAVRDALAELDAAPLGSPPALYRRLGDELERLGTRVDLPRLFQVDMTKKAAALTLGPAVIAEVERAIAFLRRWRAGAGAHDVFAAFREAFLRRYEPGRLVPLAELLDEELGIGFQRSAAIGSESSPLLQGILFPPRAAEAQISWSRAQDLLLRKTLEAAAAGAAEIAFGEAELAALAGPAGAPATPPAPFYTAFQAIFALAAPSPEAIDRGEFRLLFRGASGASGGTLLGRFCHADPELAEKVREHLRHEEAHEPDAVFAEIVHLPEGRIGNILLRPVLRGWEIPFLGQGGGDAERQLPIGDLCATVAGDQVMLFSQQLGKRVIPRLSSAHNYSLRGLGVYKFLSALQHQGTCGGLSWQWGPLDQLPFLPRVVYGRTILCPARWRVEKSETASWLGPDGELVPAALARWRQERRIPRRVLLVDADNELFVDFASPLILEAFLAIVRQRPAYVLIENLQDQEGLVVSGPEGRFTHEIVLPFVRRPVAAPAAAMPSEAPARLRRHQLPQYPPGSRWVYAKLYTGTATADGVLGAVARPLLQRFGREIATFFFLRFADPEFHLRLRFEVADEDLRRELTRELAALAGELLAAGRLWDVRFETYRPEVERYGGAAGLAQCERIFQADSLAALELLPHFQGDEGAGQRWLAALASVDGLVAATCGDDGAAQVRSLESLARGFAAEFAFDKISRQSLADRLRAEKSRLDEVLDQRAAPGSPLAAAFAAFADRRRALADPLARLRRLEQAGQLATPLAALGASFAHLTVNRLIAAEARAHEAVIYELLHRQRLSRHARQAGQAPRPAPALPRPMLVSAGGE